MYSENTSTVIYHIFTMFVYFFPLFGAILADSWLGKFRTIFYVSIIYAIGQLLLAMSAAPTLIGLPPRLVKKQSKQRRNGEPLGVAASQRIRCINAIKIYTVRLKRSETVI